MRRGLISLTKGVRDAASLRSVVSLRRKNSSWRYFGAKSASQVYKCTLEAVLGVCAFYFLRPFLGRWAQKIYLTHPYLGYQHTHVHLGGLGRLKKAGPVQKTNRIGKKEGLPSVHVYIYVYCI